jgi:hypothetical protein
MYAASLACVVIDQSHLTPIFRPDIASGRILGFEVVQAIPMLTDLLRDDWCLFRSSTTACTPCLLLMRHDDQLRIVSHVTLSQRQHL